MAYYSYETWLGLCWTYTKSQLLVITNLNDHGLHAAYSSQHNLTLWSHWKVSNFDICRIEKRMLNCSQCLQMFKRNSISVTSCAEAGPICVIENQHLSLRLQKSHIRAFTILWGLYVSEVPSLLFHQTCSRVTWPHFISFP